MKNNKNNMIQHHTIDLNELIEFRETQEVIFASSTKENKQLTMTCRGTYVVRHNGISREFMQPYNATEYYNSITSK